MIQCISGCDRARFCRLWVHDSEKSLSQGLTADIQATTPKFRDDWTPFFVYDFASTNRGVTLTCLVVVLNACYHNVR